MNAPDSQEVGQRTEPVALRRGKWFHHEVQAAYVAGLFGLGPMRVIEQTIVRPNGRRERADLLHLVTSAPERQRFVVEIKSTDWQGRSDKNRRQLFLRHLKQLDGYLDILLDELDVGSDAVVAALLYPERPSNDVVEQLEVIALSRGVMVVFYDDMNWRSLIP